jgi:hypothetical protein
MAPTKPLRAGSRSDLVKSAGVLAAGIVAAPLAGNAASFDPQTGFPKNDAKRGQLCNGSASKASSHSRSTARRDAHRTPRANHACAKEV